MEEKYRELVIEMLNKLDDEKDERFMIQLYTIIKHHLVKRGR